MLLKIISIKNVGRFRNSAAPGNPELSRYTLISGANGFGKTTICAVLRSLNTGDPAYIIGRRTLGMDDPATVELLFPSGMTRFNGTTWTSLYPEFAIFDGEFIAENVHSGEVVGIDHRRNLYRIIVGQEGVELAEEEAQLAAESRDKTSEMTAIARAIQPHVPPGMGLEVFVALTPDPAIEERIAQQERILESVKQANQINERVPLAQITLPVLPENFTALLTRTIDDVAKDAEARVYEHLDAHNMSLNGGNWIAGGLDHARETCPFCGQGIEGLPLIAAYRAVFSDRYRALRDDIRAMRDEVMRHFGDRAIGTFNVRIEQNKSAADFWGRYCMFDVESIAVPEQKTEAIRLLQQAALELLERKDAAPLEAIEPGERFGAALATYEEAQARAAELSRAIDTVNELIAAKKQETAGADVTAAERELARLKAIKARHADPVAALCADHARLTAEKDEIEKRKAEVRAQLEAHAAKVMKPYEARINYYLDAFNAGFRIVETKHGYPGGVATSTYQLLINNTPVELGDARTGPDRPSFKNTLSAGDRSTLALAFFLANLEQGQGLANKTVVFDDPFNSQDAFRRRQTVHEIVGIARRCAQVIVLSHDATFLKQVWEKAPAAERCTLTIADHRAHGSKLTSIDLERACQGRTAEDIDDLQAFLSTGTGKHLDLIRKTRVVLESHCWTTYPACFRAGEDWLGEIVRKIREGGDAHPAKDLYDPLDRINDYTSQYHHGEDVADGTPDQIDPQELTGYARLTLRIVNALQA